jgi:hypothetical protein
MEAYINCTVASVQGGGLSYLLFCGEAATENSSKPLLIFMYDLSPAGGRS